MCTVLNICSDGDFRETLIANPFRTNLAIYQARDKTAEKSTPSYHLMPNYKYQLSLHIIKRTANKRSDPLDLKVAAENKIFSYPDDWIHV